VWIFQRFHDYDEGHDSEGYSYGVAAVVFLCLSIVFTAGAMIYTSMFSVGAHDLEVVSVKSKFFLTMFILSFTNPDLLIFFPFREGAYQLEKGAFPSQTWVRLSLIRLMEDVPLFFLQVVFMLTHSFDAFTVFNLFFTSIMLLYLVLGKLIKIMLMRAQSEASAKTKKITPLQAHEEAAGVSAGPRGVAGDTGAGEVPRATPPQSARQDLVASGEATSEAGKPEVLGNGASGAGGKYEMAFLG